MTTVSPSTRRHGRRATAAVSLAVAGLGAGAAAPAFAAESSSSASAPVTRAASVPTVAKATRGADRTFGSTATLSATRLSGSPKTVALRLMPRYGWGTRQFRCLNLLWERESGWSSRASNASSGAYGIPQALPGSKMRSAGRDWRTNPVTQIRWGLGYIKSVYGTPCGAWSHSQRTGWY